MSSARVTITGKLSKDAEFVQKGDGKSYCRLAIALKHLEQDGKEKWVWYNITTFRWPEDAALRKKGAGVTITGRQTPKLAIGKDGTQKVSVDVVADSVDWHEWLPPSNPQPQVQPQPQAEAPGEDLDSIPF